MKKVAKLRKKAQLRPIIRNDTRWWSTKTMIERYSELNCLLYKHDIELIILILSPAEESELETRHKKLKLFDSVSRKLQLNSSNLQDVRILFDALLIDYPELS